MLRGNSVMVPWELNLLDWIPLRVAQEPLFESSLLHVEQKWTFALWSCGNSSSSLENSSAYGFACCVNDLRAMAHAFSELALAMCGGWDIRACCGYDVRAIMRDHACTQSNRKD
jgi:hypothetical protein